MLERDGRAGHDAARRVGDSSENGPRHRLGSERSGQRCPQADGDDQTECDSLHLRPPCAGCAASCETSDAAPKSREMACAAAMTACATSLPMSVRGMRSVGPATLIAATTLPSWL